MKFTYPSHLPISAAKDRILTAIHESQVVIISGQTGSGKTTQIPKMLLEIGRGCHGKQIVHTQPRRLAARTVAERLCQETETTLGKEIGYQIRFIDKSADHTRLKVVTDGILLAQIQQDPLLMRYDTIIIDEAHERSLNIDFLLGYLSALLPQRPDLKLIITSATIDSEKFQEHFQKVTHSTVPVIEVSGRTFPVQILYEPAGSAPALCPVTIPDQDGEYSSDDSAIQVARAVQEFLTVSKHVEGDRDILIFASGEKDIKDFETAIRHSLRPSQSVEILTLFARLSNAEQHRIFETHTQQRIIIATNIAETSLTVPGIRYVVDPGMARISRYSKTAKVQRLPIEPISQASADQRSGRTGRVADGIAIRLYSEEDYLSRERFTEPEILRTSLGSVILHMLATGIAHTVSDITGFGFIDSPNMSAISAGITELKELGAIRQQQKSLSLTKIGRQIAYFPVDERLSRVIVTAHQSFTSDVVSQILIIVAFLSIADPRERPLDKRDDAERIHKRYADQTSDFLTILNLWYSLFIADDQPSNSALRKRCEKEYLNFLHIRQWRDLYNQLVQMCDVLHFKVTDPLPKEGVAEEIRCLPLDQQAAHSLCCVWDAHAIHYALLSGFLSNLGMQLIEEPKASDFSSLHGPARLRALRRAKKQSKNNYQGTHNKRFAIFPSSTVASTTPQWIMSSTLVETSRLWARMVAEIDPTWVMSLGRDLTKTVYSAPHWSITHGAAIAQATVLFYGLPVVSQKTVQWKKINPIEARAFLIRSGLVEGQINHHFPGDTFIKQNRNIVESYQADIEKQRHVIDTVNDDDLFKFYDTVLPQEITSIADLAKWWKNKRTKNPHYCDFNPQQYVERIDTINLTDNTQYPEELHVTTDTHRTVTVKVTYRYQPGQQDDGITVHIPLEYLEHISETPFTWLVPGFRRDYIIGLIKILPKQLRVQLVPASTTADEINTWFNQHVVLGTGENDTINPSHTSFFDIFSSAIAACKGLQLDPTVFTAEQLKRLPHYLTVFYSIEETPRLSLPQHQQKKLQNIDPQRLKPKVIATGSSLHDLQEKLKDQATIASHHAIGSAAKEAIRQGKTVKGVTILNTAGATTQLRQDMLWDAAFKILHLPNERISSRWLGKEALLLASAPYKSTNDLTTDMQYAAVKRLLPSISLIKTDEQLMEQCAALRDIYEDTVYAVTHDVVALLKQQGELENHLSHSAQLSLLATIQEIRSHISTLVYPRFIKELPPTLLVEGARYLHADGLRLQKAISDKARDARWMWEDTEAHQLVDQAYQAAHQSPAGPLRDQAFVRADAMRCMYEEFRVSLWAQELGAKGHPSIKRMKKI